MAPTETTTRTSDVTEADDNIINDVNNSEESESMEMENEQASLTAPANAGDTTPDWVKILASLAALAAFISLIVVGGFCYRKYKLGRSAAAANAWASNVIGMQEQDVYNRETYV